MDRNRLLGWIFSGLVAMGALAIFWDGLVPHRVNRPRFVPPAAHPVPVEMPMPAPMELPPPVPKLARPDRAPVLPGIVPPPRPAVTSR